ncbi:hypothetical protein C8Q76DRAFT_203884 [Earliella scabrosa]|nr:hypothetical protein C8Q76DRAFT_203884 [Earliella scabrosa]
MLALSLGSHRFAAVLFPFVCIWIQRSICAQSPHRVDRHPRWGTHVFQLLASSRASQEVSEGRCVRPSIIIAAYSCARSTSTAATSVSSASWTSAIRFRLNSLHAVRSPLRGTAGPAYAPGAGYPAPGITIALRHRDRNVHVPRRHPPQPSSLPCEEREAWRAAAPDLSVELVCSSATSAHQAWSMTSTRASAS